MNRSGKARATPDTTFSIIHPIEYRNTRIRKTGKAPKMKIRAVLSGASSIAELVVSLFWTWITLGWRVRKARKAFEKQLTKEGMSKRDAKRLSRQYASLKDKLVNGVWSALTKK